MYPPTTSTMRIDRIEPSRRRKDRVLVFLEGGDLLRVTEQELLVFGLRPGLELGCLKKNRLEPAHALALWLKNCESVENFPAESREIAAFLHGETVPSVQKGWCLVCADGFSLGWGKGDGSVLKNHYPKGLRR